MHFIGARRSALCFAADRAPTRRPRNAGSTRSFNLRRSRKEQQLAELKWFIGAAEQLKAQGIGEISVVSETITTHEYEAKTLAERSARSPGIKVKHDLIQEGDVVEKLQTSMQSGRSIYDGWVTDSDLIGTHYRYGAILPLSDFIAGARQGVHESGPRPEGLHRREVHDRAGRQAVSAARSAVREPLLVSRRLVRAQGSAGPVQEEVRLRARRACELERVRGHRRVLHATT